DVYDLRTDVTFDYLATRYRGSLSYAGGKLKYGTLAPLPHSLQTQFVATRSRFTLNPMILTLGSSRVMLRGEATNYNSPRVDGSRCSSRLVERSIGGRTGYAASGYHPSFSGPRVPSWNFFASGEGQFESRLNQANATDRNCGREHRGLVDGQHE